MTDLAPRRHTAAVNAPWSALSRRVVMVARYAERDGIGRYADQLAAAYGDGREFVRIGIPEGPGDYDRAFHRGPRALWLLHDARRRDDVLLHYHPDYYVRGGAASRVASQLTWALVGALRDITAVAHEPDPVRGGRVEEMARRWAWRRRRTVVFHSDWERKRHIARFGRGAGQQLVVVKHGDFFSTDVEADRAEARRALHLAGEGVVLLMIGFLSPSDPDKGYDRAIAAVETVAGPGTVLHIVGSPIRAGPEVDALLADLRAAAARSPYVELHETYVDDEAFDLWLRAADAVLTPYRTSSSSGVMARAHLLGTRVVTADVGGLAAQAGPGDVVFRDDAELLVAVRALAHGAESPR